MKTSFQLMTLMVLTPTVFAGSLDAPSAPSDMGSAMYSLPSICARLQTGAAGSQNVFTEPTSGPGATGCTLNDVMNYAPALDNINGATPAEVIAGKTFWGLRNGDWGVLTGTYNSGSACVGTATLGNVLAGQTFSGIAGLGLTGTMTNNSAVTITPSTTNQTIAAGYHNGSGTVAGEANLVTGNIKNGVTLFGVSGKTEVVDTTEATSPATAASLLSGKKAFVNGVAVTGTVPAGANVTGAAGNLVMTIPDGLYSGSKTTTANDADLVASNIKNGIDLFGVLGTYNPLIATGTATVAQVLSGQTFSNSSSSGLTGTMTNNGAVTLTPSTTPQTIAAGYHNGSGTVVGDADLVATNIRSGVNLFGVSGEPNVVNTSTGDATAAEIASGKKAWVDGSEITGTAVPAAVPKTGQTICYDASGTSISCTGTGQDGAFQKGAALPSPRFTDNSNGTVTDNLTGLIWLKNANCFGLVNWTTALSSANGLANGTCSLTDGSTAGQWRLPNIKELHSLIDFSKFSLALSTGHPFTGVVNNNYWSASSYADAMYFTTYTWVMSFYDGSVNGTDKATTYSVLPVRGGQ